MYDEHKKVVAVSLTPTAVERLDALASSMDVSRSELIEQVARGTIPLLTNEQAHRLGESSANTKPDSVINSTDSGSTKGEKPKENKQPSSIS